jgi:pimeloyl-ACP methyl ester carboxylesterase
MQLEVISRQPARQTKTVPLLFVHGMWHGAWCWDEHFLPYFVAQGYRVYALSLRGHGGSAGHERIRWHSIAAYVQDVAHIVTTLPDIPVLIGHSMGGYIVQKYLERHPARAGVLVAAPPPGHGVWRSLLRVLRRYPLATLRAGLTLDLWPLVATPERYRWGFFPDDYPDDDLRRHHARLTNESAVAFLGMLGLSRIRPERIQVPIGVLGAADDHFFSPAEIHATAAQIIPGMGHGLPLDTDWQTVAGHILNWLEQHGF